jgi:hypothetical protein
LRNELQDGSPIRADEARGSFRIARRQSQTWLVDAAKAERDREALAEPD